MTRDEAIKIVDDHSGAKHFTESFVDALSGLGILKLDEPKSVETRLYKQLGRLPIPDDLRRTPKGESMIERVEKP